jgi:hypothetical protein
VTTSQPNGCLPGQQVQFDNITAEIGVSNGTTYWGVPVPGPFNVYQFGIAATAGGTLLAASATVTIAANRPFAVTNITNGLVTMPDLLTNLSFFSGQAIRFSNLAGGTGVDTNTTYYISVDGTETLSQFHLAASPIGPAVTAAKATGGQLSLDTAVTVQVESIVAGSVTTMLPTGYESGQAVKFSGLTNAVGFDPNATYFIQFDPTKSDVAFSISLTLSGPVLTGASAGAGTVVQTLLSTLPSAGFLLPFPQAIPVATPQTSS